jgi:C4-dicarboxylate transporter DctM subunit
MEMGLVVAIVLVLALVLSVPISMALGLAAFAGILTLSTDFLIFLPQKFLAGVDAFTLLAIPLFILAGTIMGYGGIARRIVNLAMVFVGRLRGGLGMVSILSTMFFSGVCGSASADTAAIGSVTIPAMKQKRYPAPFATAIVAAAGGTSQLVPPSIDLIIIGVVANISIGGLFAAGFLPGAVNALALMALVYYYARKLDLPLEPRLPLKDKLRQIWDGSLAVLMAVIILGGILGGVFTPTEASAVAVVYGFVVSFFIYKELKLEDIPRVLLRTCQLTGIVLLVLGMASVFSFILTFERIPHAVAQAIVVFADNWIVFVLLVNIVFLLLGMIMDALPALIILMPILVPVGIALGMEPIHIGILVQANVGISLISPPVGVCLYVACGLSKEPIETVIRSLIPFYVVLVATVLVISYVPEIALFIPRLLGYVDG